MTTLDSELLESVEKDYFDDPRVMALVDRFRCAQSEPVQERFVVRHYEGDKFPTIKGNGFMLQVGRHKKEAEQFVAWINARIAQPQPAEPVQEPAVWTLTKTLTERKTITNGHLWFSDPVNYAWTPLYTAPQPAQPFSREAISATQTAWKMGYDAGKEEQATQSAQLPPLPKNLHSLAGMIWPRIMDWYDAEAGEEAELAAQKINQAIEEQMQAYAMEALRLNGVNV